jgi:hypothetical protein
MKGHTVKSQSTYLRLHLLSQDPPPTCFREVRGSVDYTVMGWFAHMSYVQVAFLLPMTIINLSTLAILLAAMWMGGLRYKYDFEPTDTRSILGASVGGQGLRGDGDCTNEVRWGDRVTYQEQQVFKYTSWCVSSRCFERISGLIFCFTRQGCPSVTGLFQCSSNAVEPA